MPPSEAEIKAAINAIFAANSNSSGLKFSDLVRLMATDALEAAERVRPATFLWCCHIRGPDDVIPTTDYDSALKMADEVNASVAQIYATKGRTESDPIISAVPAPWPWSAEAHAASLAERAKKQEDGWNG